MVTDNVFGFNSRTRQPEAASTGFVARVGAAFVQTLAHAWCGLHGHLILLHFEPNKLSLQCGLCGYESEGWEVGRPLVARRSAESRSAENGHARPERRQTIRPLASSARLAS
jgi:hypothetical protein